MRIAKTLILLFLLGGPLTAKPARPACESLSGEKQRLACFRTDYQAADKELNRVYQSLRKKLSAPVAAELKENSQMWITLKETNCGWQSQEKKDSAYYMCLLAFTQGRIAYLKSAFGKEGVRAGVPGEYDDGFGGSLTLRVAQTPPTGESKPAPTEGPRYHFTFEVVRGPTSHTGEVEGEIVVDAATGSAKYEEGAGCQSADSGESCCRLDFQIESAQQRVKVVEVSCAEFHGARAYFDGVYRKIR